MNLITTRRTPNINNYKITPEGVVFHHSCGGLAGTIDWCCRKESQVSYHYVIAEDGDIHELAAPTSRAWHAGKSSFKGRSDCNSFMIGIAFTGDTYKRTLTVAEIESARELTKSLVNQFNIKPEMITDHRTVSPGRKDDLNPVEFSRLMKELSGMSSNVSQDLKTASIHRLSRTK
jgi:N-acetyl-anhydromuramyl-L-alanine amidase AmpD